VIPGGHSCLSLPLGGVMPELLDTTPYTSAPKKSEPVAYHKRDLILYALGIGSTDLRYVYEGDSAFAAFPTYPLVLLKKGNLEGVLPFPSPFMMGFPLPKLEGETVALDAEKFVEKVNELPQDGASMKMVGGVCGIHKKGKGALIEQELEMVDDQGKVYYRIVDSSFHVGAKNFTETGRTFSMAVPAPKETPLHVVETPTSEHINLIYRLSGDYNALHADTAVAKASGFDRPIMHGQCTLGVATRALLETLAGGNQKRFKSIQCRFAAPVFPGETLVTEIWKKSATEFIFQTKAKSTGGLCCSNGLIVLNPEAKL